MERDDCCIELRNPFVSKNRSRCWRSFPPSHSLISDYFPLEGRATALSIYALGIPIGSMVGNLVGGWGADELGWRNTFYLVGFPGIVIALFIWATLREPPRGMSDVGIDHSKDDTPAPSIKETFTFLWKKRAFKHIALAAGLHAFVSYGAVLGTLLS